MKRFLPVILITAFLFSLLLKAGAQTNQTGTTITASIPTGSISACAGAPSDSPYIQQFTVSGSNLTTDITAAASTGFEVSLTAGSGYGNSITIPQSAGAVNNTVVYVRSAASAAVGSNTGTVTLTSGSASQTVSVSETINALPTVDPVADQTVLNGVATTAVNFTGTATTFKWVNNTPGIGLPASGTGNIASFTAINTGATPVIATVTVTPVPTAIAYVANYNGHSISVLNTATNAVTATIPVGTNPIGVAVSPDGSMVYVTNQGSGNVSVINTITAATVATVAVGEYPTGVAVSPDGSKVYVTNGESNSVSVINTATNTVNPTIFGLSEPGGISVSPDGSKVYVANEGENNVSVISTATNTITATIAVGTYPIGTAISPDGNTLYVANGTSNTLSVINMAKNSVTTIPVGTGPHGVSISPDGSTVYIVNSNTVTVISAATNKTITTIPVGNGTFGLSVSPDGSLVYVPNALDNNVSVISTATNTVTNTVNVGSNPEAFGNFISAGTGCSGNPVSFNITVNPSPGPVIIASGNLSPLNTIYGTASSSTVFNVSGANLTAGILITPPPGFEVSTDDITFKNTVTVSAADAASPTQIYIRLAATAKAGNYSGNIVLSSTGAANVNVPMPNSIVNPAPLIITADNKIKTYGTENPVLTATFTGFVNGDGIQQLTVLPVISTTAVTSSPPGQYPITVSGAESPDYDITYVPGTLTIDPAAPTIVIPNTFTPNGDGINDYWDIKNMETYPNCTIDIYNRYGERVYSSIGYGVPWDGTYKGALLPTGTYYYLINLKNNSKVLSGYITLIR